MHYFGVKVGTDVARWLMSHYHIGLTFDLELLYTISGTFPCDLHCGIIEVQLLGLVYNKRHTMLRNMIVLQLCKILLELNVVASNSRRLEGGRSLAEWAESGCPVWEGLDDVRQQPAPLSSAPV